MPRAVLPLALLIALLPVPAPAVDARAQIEAMKASETGPFAGVSWFCADGAVLPPRPFACEPRGGGRQHGDWSEATRALRGQGYLIANVLAAVDPQQLAAADDQGLDLLSSVLIERYLMARDDGWIWRGARYFRGVLQHDDERAVAAQALQRMLDAGEWIAPRLLLLREAVRLLPGGASENALWRLRTLSNALADRHPGFGGLRNKLHTDPAVSDAAAIRQFAASNPDPDFETLATLVARLHAAGALSRQLRRVARHNGALSAQALALARTLEQAPDPLVELDQIAELMVRMRQIIVHDGTPAGRLELLRLMQGLEARVFAGGRVLLAGAEPVARSELLRRLRQYARILYAAGFVTWPELQTALVSISRLRGPEVSLARYRHELELLARVPGWSAGRLNLYFAPMMDRLAEIEPLAAEYITDRLRGSPALIHAEVLLRLQQDMQQLSGVSHELFGVPVSRGVTALNPGLASGRLVELAELDAMGDGTAIVIAGETTADLPVVAGIITAGAGNSLSHVQLLARNLGVPNLVLDLENLAVLRARRGQPITLAVSPGGLVRISDATDAVLVTARGGPAAPAALTPDLDRLKLGKRRLRGLHTLRAVDSGRTVGPKAARLGELASRFPGTVSAGLAIPFGEFSRLLKQPFERADGQPMAHWLQAQYGVIARMQPGPERAARISQVLAAVRAWLRQVPLPDDLLRRLRTRMAEEFGPEGSYGVFVRSDTNIEDLPNFSGAGLNKTVPHVVGFEATLTAIREVWASVFSERAWGWRQAMIPDPMQVYAAVLLHRSVDVDLSGVLLSTDPASGDKRLISVVVNEGPGGGVAGQAAESLLMDRDGKALHLASASEPWRLALAPQGGVRRVRSSGRERLLGENELAQLAQLVRDIETRAADLVTEAGVQQPADVEFGFAGGRLVLFQIRPMGEDRRARNNAQLSALDARLRAADRRAVDLSRPAAGGAP